MAKGIPFVDLVTPHVELQDELMSAVKGVISTGMFVGGPIVEQFEQEFATLCSAKHSVAVASGTDALRFALIAAGVGKGDLVVTVANTFVATIEAIVQAGATPYLIDVDRRTFNMDVAALQSFLRNECEFKATGLPVHRETGCAVKAIMPVHLYGQMCDMDALEEVASQYGLMIFEDACQAHGSEYFSVKRNAWTKAGSIGIAAAFSFYPGKNLGACGEGGAVTTNDDEIARKIRMIRDHGQNKKYHHAMEGYNGRLDAMQAALLRVKLPHLPAWNANRRLLAESYNQLLQGLDGLQTPFEPEWSRGNYHLYVVTCSQGRDELQKYLGDRNIATGLHYPIPLHKQAGYSLKYKEGSLQVTEQLAGSILSLPMYPQLSRKQQEEVATRIGQFCEELVGTGKVG